ncbi:uncharacterized protein VTP21DRAFT_6548 [Calcarisporiella thermophila]|uniref:uncharacterized protein n=1 Tax=Calcarisporiella thermophila TaxID=911321 RepID=UPI0037421FBA
MLICIRLLTLSLLFSLLVGCLGGQHPKDPMAHRKNNKKKDVATVIRANMTAAAGHAFTTTSVSAVPPRLNQTENANTSPKRNRLWRSLLSMLPFRPSQIEPLRLESMLEDSSRDVNDNDETDEEDGGPAALMLAFEPSAGKANASPSSTASRAKDVGYLGRDQDKPSILVDTDVDEDDLDMADPHGHHIGAGSPPTPHSPPPASSPTKKSHAAHPSYVVVTVIPKSMPASSQGSAADARTTGEPLIENAVVTVTATPTLGKPSDFMGSTASVHACSSVYILISLWSFVIISLL